MQAISKFTSLPNGSSQTTGSNQILYYQLVFWKDLAMDKPLDTTPGISIHTGFPNPATDSSLQTLNLHELLVPHAASTYFMRITNNDWRAIGVFAHDIAIVDRALQPAVHDIAVWLHEGEFALSRYNQIPHGAVVWGVVTSIIHQFKAPKRSQ